MSWHSSWRPLAARIHGFVEASARFAPEPILRSELVGSTRSQHARALDPPGILGSFFGPTSRSIIAAIKEFSTVHSSGLPKDAKALICRFIRDHAGLFESSQPPDINSLRAWAAVLAGLLSEFEYSVSDHEVRTVGIVERAFVHLQRLIAVDTVTASAWQAAFNANEMRCEKLGGVHLLHHGIWAFKADSLGGRTDLVLGSPGINLEDARRTTDGLVLTEWKLARNPSEVESAFASALRQAKLYSTEILAGFEVSSVRFLVVVTESRSKDFGDQIDGSIRYRRVNIAVDPEPPSKARI